MADNPRLIIELQDRSGTLGSSATNPNQPGSSDVPGSTTAADFQKKITEQGAGTVAPSQSTPAGPDPLGSALDNQTRQNTPSQQPTSPPVTSGYQGPQQVNPSLLPMVSGLLASDPNVTRDELSAALGITKKEAQELIAQAKASQRDNAPASVPTSDSLGGSAGMPSRARGGTPSGLDIDPATGIPLARESRPDDGYSGLGQGRGISPPSSAPSVDPVTGRLQDIPPVPRQRPDDGYGGLGQGTSYASIPSSPTSYSYMDPATGIVDKLAKDLATPMNAELVAEKAEVTGKQVAMALNSLANTAGIGGTNAGGIVSGIGGLVNAAFPGGIGPAGSALVGLATNPVTLGIGAALGIGATGLAIAENEAARAESIIGNLSPEVAQAKAEAEIRQVMANFRTANRLGDETADYVRASSLLDTEYQRTRDRLGEGIINDLAALKNGTATLLKIYNDVQEGPLATKSTGSFVVDMALKASPPGFQTGAEWALGEKFKDLFERNHRNLVNFGDWIEEQLPHLEPPPPFNKADNQKPVGVVMAPVPGLNF